MARLLTLYEDGRKEKTGGGFPMIGRLKRVAQGAANVPISF